MRPVTRRRAPWAVPLLALLALSCGDDGGGGCGSEEPKKQEESSGGGGGAPTGGGGGATEIAIYDKKSKKVPKPYSREGGEDPAVSASGGVASPAAEAKPQPAAEAAAPASTPPATSTAPARVSLPVARVIRRRVDGISNRVEVKCRVMASSGDGECSSAPNYQEIKDKCCPGGIVERCKVGLRGVILIGLDCEAGLKK